MRRVSLDGSTRETPAQRHSPTRADTGWMAVNVYDAQGVRGFESLTPTPVRAGHVRHTPMQHANRAFLDGVGASRVAQCRGRDAGAIAEIVSETQHQPTTPDQPPTTDQPAPPTHPTTNHKPTQTNPRQPTTNASPNYSNDRHRLARAQWRPCNAPRVGVAKRIIAGK